MHASVLRGCTEIPPLVRKCDLRYERGYFRERYFSARNKFRAKNDRFSSRRARRELCEAFDQWQPSASQSLPVRAKSFRSVFPATCAVKKLLRARATRAPRADQAGPKPRAISASMQKERPLRWPFLLSKKNRRPEHLATSSISISARRWGLVRFSSALEEIEVDR